MSQLTLERGYSVGLMLIVTAVAILLVTAFYWRAFGTLRRGQWQTLLFLRVLAIVIVVLLLFRPVFSYHKESQERPALIFLVDTSASMSIADNSGGIKRFDQARTQLEKWWEQLKDDFRLHLIEFSDRPRKLEDISQLATLVPEGKSTSMSRALAYAAKELPPKEIQAIILVSDGIHNSAGNPNETAMKNGIVVHTIGVGASLRSDVSYRDIQVTGIDCPDRLMMNNKAKITGAIEGIGLGGRVIRVILEDDGQPIQEAELTLDDIEGSQRVDFEITPARKGRHVYTVRVPPVPEEKIVENNQRSAIAQVVEPGIRVLYIEGTLRAEYGALVDRFLSKDPDLEFYALVQTRQNNFLKRTNMQGLNVTAIPTDPETLGKFDVFIIGDLDSTYLKPDVQQLLVQRVKAGSGLVMLGGYHSLGPGGYGGTPVGEMLPAMLGSREIGQLNDSFLPVLTPEGVRHPIFANIGDFFPTKTGDAKLIGLPPLDGATRIQSVRAGASVLANAPAEAGGMPVLAVQPVERGRTAVFCGDTTRKWQQGPRAMDQQSPFLRFWGQMVRFLAGRSAGVEAKAGIIATADKAFYEPDDPVQIAAVVRDERGEGTAEAKVSAKVRGPGGRSEEFVLSAVAGPAGHYSESFKPEVSGKYDITVEARVGEQTLTADKIAIEVGRPNLEFEKLDMNERLLVKIASDTGGRYAHITTANDLIERLDRTQQKKREEFTIPVFSPPWFWTLFVGLLTVEWVLRRRFQLR